MKAKRRNQTIRYISRIEIANLMHLSASRVSQLVSEGVLTQDARGRHRREETLLAIIEHFRRGSELSALKREKLERQNRILARAEAREEGDLVSRKEAEDGWCLACIFLRDRLLLLPAKLASRIAYLSNEVIAEAEFRSEIEAVLTELSKPRSSDEWNVIIPPATSRPATDGTGPGHE